MVRNRLFGALRTVLEYVVFVMGGTAVLVMFARGVGILWSFNPEFVHPGFRAAFVSGCMYFYALSTNWGRTEYQLFKIHSINDPQLQLYFVKWTPAEGEVREEPIGKFAYTSRYLTGLEIEQLRTANLTGILQTWGHTGHEYPPPETRRFVIVMSRPVQETIELPKPAFVDILYVHTEQGWKVFPPSVQTVSRTVRLTFSGPESHISLPSTRYYVDIGLGYPAEIPFTNKVFSWLPEEFQAPVPSLPDQPRSSSAAPPGPG